MLLDTDTIIDWLRGHETTVEWLKHEVTTGRPLCVSGITVAEVFSGTSADKREERQDLLATFRYIPLSFAAAQEAGQLRRRYLEAGQSIALPDILQAAIARGEGAIIATANEKHFPDAETINPRTSVSPNGSPGA